MRILCVIAAVLLLATSVNGCSSSSSAGVPSRSVTTVPLVFVEDISLLGSGTAVFTAYDTFPPQVWKTNYTDEGTEALLMNARVLQDGQSGSGRGIVWRARVILRTHDGPSGGLFWLTDGTVEGTEPFFDISEPPYEVSVRGAILLGDLMVFDAFFFNPGDPDSSETRIYRINLRQPNEPNSQADSSN